MYRSEHILKGLSNQYYRATYKSMGFTTEDLKRPIIGIANAWSECVPGHYNPVSYTHLDVYKRQVPVAAVRGEVITIYVKWTPLTAKAVKGVPFNL